MTTTRPSATVEAARGETVLVVEDEPAILRVVTGILRTAGYVVLPASGGADALGKFHEHRGRVDLVVTDVMMPDTGGPALVEKIREIRPAIPVIFISGYAGTITPTNGTVFVSKPFAVDELLRVVRDMLTTTRPAK